MTPEEFRVEMEKLRDSEEDPDCEFNHARADKLLCRALRELGYGAGIDIYNDPDWTRWYS